MTKKQRKNIASIVGICGILSILGGCTQKANVSTNGSSIQSPTNNTTNLNTTNIVQQLSIKPICIGCGKCIQTASNTFVMEGSQATVISQEHIQSQAVKKAINDCPVEAIEIIEV